MKKSQAMTLGLMSGTSVDGIDASIVVHNEAEDHLMLHLQEAYPKALRQEILDLVNNPMTNLSTLTRMHYKIGEAFANTAEKAIKAAKQKKMITEKMPLLAIGSHGQTVFHHPEAKRTLQIGEASFISVKTGITTVSDFRVADTAVGGEGAPLLPIYHQRIFKREAKKGLAVHNLGGISNYTYLGPDSTLFALDNGPANCLLDAAIQWLTDGKKKYDENGALAKKGKVNSDLMNALRRDPGVAAFHAKRAPKSTGRELFSLELILSAMEEISREKLSPEDILRTLAQFTVDLIVESYEKEILQKSLPLQTVVFAGGGTKNSFLLASIQAHYPKLELRTMEDFGFNSLALEAQAFGYFAWCALRGVPITSASTTGAKQPVICGKISPGRYWRIERKKR